MKSVANYFIAPLMLIVWISVASAAPIDELATDLWLLTHEDLRQTARVRAFMDFMAGSIAGDRVLIEGRRPAQAPPRRAGAGRPRR